MEMNAIETLKERFATIGQVQGHEGTSDKYSFISTERVLGVFADHGWLPSKVQEARTRKVENKGFQKHLIRLRNSSISNFLPGHHPEIVLVNSHLGSSSFRLMAGVYRLICSNGMIAGSTWADYRVKHIGYTDSAVEDAIKGISLVIPELADGISSMSSISLTDSEKLAFAKSAIELKQIDTEEDGTKKYAIRPESLLSPWRYDDRKNNDLWTVTNNVQENLMKGGYRMTGTNGQRRRARATTSVDENVRLNQSLWTLAEEMRKLKQAA